MDIRDSTSGRKAVIDSTGGAVNVAVVSGGGGTITPSNYDGITGTLTAAGDGYALASGAILLSIGVQTAAAGPILIAFGTSEVDAEANVVGTVGSEVGMLLGAGAAGDVYVVGIPDQASITHYAIAENHATPTGVVIVTQGA